MGHKNSLIFKLVGSLALAVFLIASSGLRHAQAEIIATEEAGASVSSSAHQSVREFFSREDVGEQLLTLGISPQEASARVNSLSEAEARELSDVIDQMPSGGGDLGTVLAAVLIVFFVLLFTDILGMTKVYPFTRSVH